MSKNFESGPVGFLFENHLLSSVVSLALLIAGIVTVSASLLVAAGIVAYGWPFLYVYLLNRKTASETTVATPSKRLTAVRPSVAGAH